MMELKELRSAGHKLIKHEDNGVNVDLPTGGLSCTSHGIDIINETTYNNLTGFPFCSLYKGNLAIDPIFASTNKDPLQFTSLVTLNGSLILGNASGQDVTFPDLATIYGTLDLTGLAGTTLALSIPSLIYTKALTLSGTGLVDTHAISLNSITSQNLSIDTLTISDNSDLRNVSFPAVKTLGSLSITDNSQYPFISFEALTTAINVNINYVGNFSAPGLQTISDEFSSLNTTFKSLDFPVLKSVGSNFELVNSYSLNALNLPALESIGTKSGGDFKMTSDSPSFVPNITLPSLTAVGGSMEIDGDISVLSMINLKSVDGSIQVSAGTINATVYPTDTPLNCNKFLAALESQLPTNQVACDSTTIHPTPTALTAPSSPSEIVMTNSAGVPTATSIITPTSTASSSHHKSSSSGLSTGAKAGIGVAAALIIIALIAFLAFFLRRRRSTSNKSSSISKLERDQSKQLDYSPMIGEGSSLGVAGAGTVRYQDTDPVKKGALADADYDGERGRSVGMNGAGASVVDGNERPVSPVSVASGLRRSFGSRDVSPESIDRVPLGDR